MLSLISWITIIAYDSYVTSLRQIERLLYHITPYYTILHHINQIKTMLNLIYGFCLSI